MPHHDTAIGGGLAAVALGIVAIGRPPRSGLSMRPFILALMYLSRRVARRQVVGSWMPCWAERRKKEERGTYKKLMAELESFLQFHRTGEPLREEIAILS
ncbi:hypothetical protein DFH07DRAFT_951697 [Mycena maculata]|uniref:Uncharacterized protein n=1 Tax=Mycena maculata TaxID=230809 RepID=A0AAD7NVB8_9AGAR|nr:hypothetical protein DFH07DRAFT_951697 [Mycena maculata]